MVRYLASSLVADNPLQKIGQAVSGENYPPISKALSGGNVADRLLERHDNLGCGARSHELRLCAQNIRCSEEFLLTYA